MAALDLAVVLAILLDAIAELLATIGVDLRPTREAAIAIQEGSQGCLLAR
jgi:hypothetical protein